MPKYIVLNGPAKSGKDTIGQALHALLVMNGYKSIREKFAAPLKDGVAAFLGLTQAERLNYFEHPYIKDMKIKRFMGKTPRQMLISFSEDWVKPQFGKECFGELLRQRTASMQGYVVVTDCGFDDELEPFDKTDIAVIRLQRQGCTFEGDSRKYIIRDDVFSTDIVNNDDPNVVAKNILNLLTREGFLEVNIKERV